MKTIARAICLRHSGIFTKRQVYDIQITYSAIGYKVHVIARRVHNSVKLLSHLQQTYKNNNEFNLSWQIVEVGEIPEQQIRQRKGRKGDEQ